MSIERWTGLQEHESELLILNPLVLNDGTPAPAGKPAAGYQYRLPIQGHRWRCRSLSVIPSEDYDPAGLCGPGQLNNGSSGYRDWLLTLVNPTGDVLHKDIPLTQFLRNPAALGLAGARGLPFYFADESYFDARQSFVVTTDPNTVKTRFLVFRFVYA